MGVNAFLARDAKSAICDKNRTLCVGMEFWMWSGFLPVSLRKSSMQLSRYLRCDILKMHL